MDAEKQKDGQCKSNICLLSYLFPDQSLGGKQIEGKEAGFRKK